MALYDRETGRPSIGGPLLAVVVLGAILLMLAVGWLGSGEPADPQARIPEPISAPPSVPPAPPIPRGN